MSRTDRLLTSLIALVSLMIGLEFVILYRQPSSAMSAATRGPDEARPGNHGEVRDARPAQSVMLKDFPTLGSSSAKVALIEFADFECPYCIQHANSVFSELKERYVS